MCTFLDFFSIWILPKRSNIASTINPNCPRYRMITHTFTNINILPVQLSSRWCQDQLILHSQQDGKVVQKVARLPKMAAVQPTFLF